jgi:hypothetical protein
MHALAQIGADIAQNAPAAQQRQSTPPRRNVAGSFAAKPQFIG